MNELLIQLCECREVNKGSRADQQHMQVAQPGMYTKS